MDELELTNELKTKIDSMTYDDMLLHLRFAPIGDPMFQKGPVSDYFGKSMKEKKKEVDPVAASKRVGWD